MSLNENKYRDTIDANLKFRVQRVDSGTNHGEQLNGSGKQFFNHASNIGNPHINEMKKRRRVFFQKANYGFIVSAVILPLAVLIYVLKSAYELPHTKTIYFSLFYYNITFLAFSAGYHKFFAHRAFRSPYRALHYLFAIFGSSLGLGSIKWWCGLHRAHHFFTDDTDRDPYLVKRGILWAHLGWLVWKPKVSKFYEEFVEQEFGSDETLRNLHTNGYVKNEANEPELYNTPESYDENRDYYNTSLLQVVQWQEKCYPFLFILTTFVVPSLVAVFYCDDSFINGFIFPGVLRMFICQQSVLATESVCHMKGAWTTIPTQPYDDKNSSVDCLNPLITLLTYGQSQQNFHHEFTRDYRCSTSALSFDPTKWFIWSLSKLKLVDYLIKTPDMLIIQTKIQQQQEIINRMKSNLNWGTPISKLPLIKPRDFNRIVSSATNDRTYIIISGIIHDVTPFVEQHPGGVPLLKASHGKDATRAFFGGVYEHLTAAKNLLATMRIGVIDSGNSEEWNRLASQEIETSDLKRRRHNKLYKTAEAA